MIDDRCFLPVDASCCVCCSVMPGSPCKSCPPLTCLPASKPPVHFHMLLRPLDNNMKLCTAGQPTAAASTPPVPRQPFSNFEQHGGSSSNRATGGLSGNAASRMPHPKFPSADIWHPGTEAERAMDELDAANWLVFGNRNFRLDQHNIIKAALQVIRCTAGFDFLPF